jgi:eukaryotic-like serine/threonine-protein kinase
VGPYRVLHQLGAGVLGPVFRAHDPDADRLVAIKLFQLDFTPEQARELAQALDALCDRLPRHPAIVAPITAGLEGSSAYLATECVAADSLDARLRRRVTGGFRQSLPVLRQVAEAIDAAASADIRHGALHPRDILVTTTGATQVTGFGIAETVEGAGGRAPLRRPYAAPERIAREVWDTRADIYSLGIMATELLAGRRPGSGAAPSAITDLLVQSEGLDSETCRRALARALAEAPSARWHTAREFLIALEAAVIDEDMAEPWNVGTDSAAAASGAAPAAVPFVVTRPGDAEPEGSAAASDLHLVPPVAFDASGDDFTFRSAPSDDGPEEDLFLETPTLDELREPEELFAPSEARQPASEPPREQATAAHWEPESATLGDDERADEHDDQGEEDEERATADAGAEAGEAVAPAPERMVPIAASRPPDLRAATDDDDRAFADEYDAGMVSAYEAGDESDETPGGPEPAFPGVARQPSPVERTFEFESDEEHLPQQDAVENDEEAAAAGERLPGIVPLPVPGPSAESSSRPPRTFLSAEPLDGRSPPLQLGGLLLLGLMVGLLAGYLLWGRTATVGAPPPAETATTGTEDTGVPPPEQVYSEEPLDERGAPARVDGTPPPATPTGRPEAAPARTPAAPAVRPAPRAEDPRPQPPPPARQTQVAGQGTLEVVSRPAGARVTIDKKAAGVTPLKTSVAAGRRTIRLELDGYAPWSRTITVDAGRPTRIGASLELRR